MFYRRIVFQSPSSPFIELFGFGRLVKCGESALQWRVDAEHRDLGIGASCDGFHQVLVLEPGFVAVERGIHVDPEELNKVLQICHDTRLRPHQFANRQTFIAWGVTCAERKHKVRVVHVRPECGSLLFCNFNGVIVKHCAVKISLARRAVMELLEILRGSRCCSRPAELKCQHSWVQRSQDPRDNKR